MSVTAETKSHDTWFRCQVQEALKDACVATPHPEVMHQAQALIDDKQRENS